jgi:glycosyltransferase involved in cell wall biosynthesis
VNIFCLCLVRDEADIIGHTLDAALRWARAIFVCDNGSTDGTWDVLQDYAKRHPQVVLVEREYGLYSHALWGKLANNFLEDAKEGDWWCRLDADEIYIDDPRRFLAHVAACDQVVFSASVHYYFTEIDLAKYEQNPASYSEQWKPGRLRYYLTNWSEERFVRHVPGVEWQDGWPSGFWQMWSAPKRIRLQHFQYRSPPQIQRRLETRLTNNDGFFVHERKAVWVPRGLREQDLIGPRQTITNQELWRTRIVRADALDYDHCNGQFRINSGLLPPLWGHRPLWKRALRRARVAVGRRSPAPLLFTSS